MQGDSVDCEGGRSLLRTALRNAPAFVICPALAFLLAAWLSPYEVGSRTTVVSADHASVHVKRPLRLRAGGTAAFAVEVAADGGSRHPLEELRLHHAECISAVDEGVSAGDGVHRHVWTIRARRAGRCALDVELSPALAAAWGWPSRQMLAPQVEVAPRQLRVTIGIDGVTGLPPLEQGVALAGGLAAAACLTAGRAVRRRRAARRVA